MRRIMNATKTRVSSKIVFITIAVATIVAASVITATLTAQETFNFSATTKPGDEPAKGGNVCCLYDDKGHKSKWADSLDECLANNAIHYCDGDRMHVAEDYSVDRQCSCTSCYVVRSSSRYEIDCQAKVTISGIVNVCGKFIFDNPLVPGGPCIDVKATVDVQFVSEYVYSAETDSCEPPKEPRIENEIATPRCADNDECSPDQQGSYESVDCTRKKPYSGKYCVAGKCTSEIPKS